MKHLIPSVAALLLSVAAVFGADTPQNQPIDAEVVFVLDTTGSMGGLIEGAKQKIWSIAADIRQNTGGKVRIGLLPYRDRGDVYVTRFYPLSDDLDQVFCDLQSFRADGGGDAPESVNQALFEAVTMPQWSIGNPRVMKTIFLVGDCPPHMDYQDDVKYQASCKLAAAKNIVINTVQCGSNSDTIPHWSAIASLTNGSYSQIGQSGDMRIHATPYDGEIARITIELGRTTLPYGSRTRQDSFRRKTAMNVSAKPAVVAARNEFKSAAMEVCDAAAPVDGDDLVAAPEKLKELTKDELPAELSGLTPDQQRARIAELAAKRVEFNRMLLELNRQRADYLKREAARSKAAPASFDAEVRKSIERQLKSVRSGVTLSGKEEGK